MRIKMRTKILMGILIVALGVGAVQIALGAGSTNTPCAYVLYDGTDYVHIEMEDLIPSYLNYLDNPDSDEAKLAKFYFDTIASDPMNAIASYVSEVSEKFVSYSDVISIYVNTMDVDSTYIWFNSREATPAFTQITKVKLLGADCTVTGRVYVDTDGYIIERSNYSIGTTAPSDADLNRPVSFNLTVTGDDIGANGFTGLLTYEVTGGAYTLEYNDSGAWVTLTGGTISPPGGFDVPVDWDYSAELRFTPLTSATYGLTFRLETADDEVVCEKTHSIYSYEQPVVPNITVPGFVRMRVRANTQDVDVNLYNPAGNPCYFKISLLLANEMVLYESGWIAPGMGLYTITLNEALAPGMYDAVVKYETFALLDNTPMNGVEMHIELIAE